MVMPFFADSASRDALEAAADVHGWYLRAGIAQLIEMSLLETNEELVEARKRYSAHPLVIAFAGAKLREQPEFEQQARERWSEYFLEFAGHHLVSDSSLGRYWNALSSPNLKPTDLANLLEVLTWADQSAQDKFLIEMMMLMAHYLGHLELLPKRIDYARKAASAANKLGQQVDEALFRIDALAWTLTEVGFFDEAVQEITTSLNIAKNLSTCISDNLIALGHAFLARIHLENGQILKASSMMDIAMPIDCKPIIRSRVYMIAGEVAYKQQDNLKAIKLYHEAIRISPEYGNEGQNIELHHRLGFAHLAKGELEEAESEFNKLRHPLVTIDSLYSRFGFACIAQAKGQTDKARELAQEVFNDLSPVVPTHRLLKQVTDFLHSLDESS